MRAPHFIVKTSHVKMEMSHINVKSFHADEKHHPTLIPKALKYCINNHAKDSAFYNCENRCHIPIGIINFMDLETFRHGLSITGLLLKWSKFQDLG